MDIEKYIKTKSNYGYVIQRDDGSLITVILGDSSWPVDEYAPVCDKNIHLKYRQMKNLFSQDILSLDNKKDLANLLRSMLSICHKKLKGLCTPAEQIEFVNSLSVKEKAQLIEQIEMRKQCEQYCKDYLY